MRVRMVIVHDIDSEAWAAENEIPEKEVRQHVTRFVNDLVTGELRFRGALAGDPPRVLVTRS